MERHSSLLWVSFLLLLLWSCDTSVTSSSKEENGDVLRHVPGSDLKQSPVSTDRGSRYTCSVYARTKPGSETPYRFYSSIHFFSEEMVERSRGQTTKRVFIITGDPSVGELQSDWSYAGYDHVLQTATCRLPAVEGIEQEMIRRFTEIAPGKNSRLSAVADPGAIRVHALRPDDLPEEPDEEPVLMGDPLPEPEPIAPEGCGWYCTYYWIIIHSSGGDILQVEVECDSDSWTLACNVGEGTGGGLPLPPPGPIGGGGGGGSGGSGDPGGTPDPPSPCEYLMEPAPWMCEDTSHFLGSIIIDESLEENPKAECVYNRLTSGSSNNTFTKTLAKFAGENTQFDLVIELADLGSSINGSLSSSGASNPFYLQINENRINNRTPIEIAITFLHEAIHAEMRRYLYGATDTSTLPGFPGDFGEDWSQFVLAKYGAINSGSVTSSEHHAMAQNYVGVIAQGLMEFDHFNQNYNYKHYEALAWNGLINTEAWNNLSQAKKNELGSNYQNALQGRSLECN